MDAQRITMKRDPGLQPERTAVAWTRTFASLIVNALVLARAGLGSHGTPLLLEIGGGLFVMSFALFLLATKKQAVRESTRHFSYATHEIGLTAVLTTLTGISATYAIFYGP